MTLSPLLLCGTGVSDAFSNMRDMKEDERSVECFDGWNMYLVNAVLAASQATIRYLQLWDGFVDLMFRLAVAITSCSSCRI